jgi:hypothetical protein
MIYNILLKGRNQEIERGNDRTRKLENRQID